MKKVIKITSKYLEKLGHEEDETLLDQTINRVATEADIIAEESGKIFGKISDLSVDSDGDIIIPAGINLDRYLKNPVVLFNHSLEVPIGKCEYIALENDGAYATFTLASIEEAQKIYTLLKEKVLNTLSIGFIINEVVLKGSSEFSRLSTDISQKYKIDMSKCKKIITKCTLYEFSVVTIPANENAIVIDVKKFKEVQPVIIKKATIIKKLGNINDKSDKIEFIKRWGI